MKLQSLILCLIATTTFSKEKTNLKSSTPDRETHKAISWIETNLTPANGLKGHTIRKTMLDTMSDHNVSGVSMVFIENDRIVWKKTYGYATLELSEIVSDDTVFNGASLSKPLTAVAALKLVEDQKLNLDVDVNQTLIGWQIPENEFTLKEKVTLRHLLSHRSGVKNDLWSSYLPGQKVPTLLQLLSGEAPSTDPASSVIAIPGSTERYSNTGYSVIQKLIEDVTEKKFEEVLDELVFKPSNMNQSSFQQPMPKDLENKRAIGYDGDLKPFSYKLFPYKAAGGVWTTPTDMAKFVITIFNNYAGEEKLLSQAMTKSLFSRDPIRLAFDKIYDDSSEDLVFRHYGTNQGFSSYLFGSIHKKQAFVIMTNGHMKFEFLDYVARAVAEYYQWDFLKPVEHLSHPSTVKDLQSYVSEFKLNDQKMSFFIDENKLLINTTDSELPKQLVQISPGEFISTSDSMVYQFLKARSNGDGTFVWLRITSSGGSENYAERIKAY